MANRVFISFRFRDGYSYKDELVERFSNDCDVINCSENENRAGQSEETIRKYLYNKLRHTSVTIVILSPDAVNHEKKGEIYDDWMHDEIRYSLENRENNKPNGLIAVYTPEAEKMLVSEGKCFRCGEHCPIRYASPFDNLVWHNMMNVKPEFKRNRCDSIYDDKWDSYCSLVSWDSFLNDYVELIKNADEKRSVIEHYDYKKNLNK